MKTVRFLTAGAVATGLAIAAFAPIAAADTYYGPGLAATCAGDVTSGTPLPPSGVTGPSLNSQPLTGECYTVPAAATSATVVATSSTGAPPALNVSFQDVNGNNVGMTSDLCTGSGTVAVPTGAAYFYVFTDDPATATAACGSPSVATTGTITVTF